MCELLFTAKPNGTFLRRQTNYAQRLLNEAMQRTSQPQPPPAPFPLPVPAGPAPIPLPMPAGPTPLKGPALGFLKNLQIELNFLVKEDK